jgi:TPR repeat protein
MLFRQSEKARAIFEICAKRGHAGALFRLGLQMERDSQLSQPRNQDMFQQAVKFFKQAAAQGDSSAREKLQTLSREDVFGFY